jgi:hypothetical protein
MAVFWVVAPCSLVEVYRRFRGPCCLRHRSDDEGSKDLCNIYKLVPDYTALQPRRQPSSFICAGSSAETFSDLNGLHFTYRLSVYEFHYVVE